MLNNPSKQQANPDELFAEKVVTKIDRTISALESNKSAVHKWFWKGLLAFNLVMWSVALCAAFLRSV